MKASRWYGSIEAIQRDIISSAVWNIWETFQQLKEEENKCLGKMCFFSNHFLNIYSVLGKNDTDNLDIKTKIYTYILIETKDKQ